MTSTRYVNARKRWFATHRPDKDGNYVCALCLLPVHASVTTIDHIKGWAAYPELRFVLSNFQPAHEKCNNARGIFIRKLNDRGTKYITSLLKQTDTTVHARFERYLAGTEWQDVLQKH